MSTHPMRTYPNVARRALAIERIELGRRVCDAMEPESLPLRVRKDARLGATLTEIEADEVGASLKWATTKVERTSQRGNGDRSSGRERAAERGGDFNDAPPSEKHLTSAPGSAGALHFGSNPGDERSDLILTICAATHLR
jgi:hypothetical protein